ncbi:phosphate starvation-inducible protein PhoH [Gordonia sp. TBRC 11910]|uniref:PhoH-like protein n=1 Tax=Gordonia asplenii TaxID=2725283 RepID=A0A848KSX9_9ACTN|nr:phosphate starvation-inducible protein PhoH [Gordonia asplenii]
MNAADGASARSSSAESSPTVNSTVDVAPESVFGLLGTSDINLRTLEELLPADIHVRGNRVTLTGVPADVAASERVLDELLSLVRRGTPLTPDAVRNAVSILTEGTGESPAEVLSLDIISRRGKTIRPKTLNQKKYVDAIDKHTIVFGLGPAGTGKTYLAMAKAVAALQSKQVTRIILTRPAVEAGERLGFLPGTLSEKIDPYLRPLYDALHDMMDPDSIPKLMAAGVIEVAPLAYMRGRAQPVSTRVLTPGGFRQIGEIKVGDFVVGSSGKPTQVLGVYPQGFKDIVRVTAQDGASTLCSTDHLWSVYTRADRRRGKGPRVLETKEMIGHLRAAHYHRYELPMLDAPVEFAEREVPTDPYGLAAMLDPTSGVDERYLVNSADVRLAVLQGLLDADADTDGEIVRVAVASDRRRDDVTYLVQSLGGTAIRHDAHVIDIRLPEGLQPFRLARKAEKYVCGGFKPPRRYIDSIESVGTDEAVCISVAAEDSLYVTEDFLLTHNTLNDAFIILDEAQNTTGEQMKMFLTRLGFGSKIVVTGDVTQVDLPGGAESGLNAATRILEGIDDIHFARLTSADVVRHRLVANIVDAYGRAEESARASNSGQLRGNRAARRAGGPRSS